MTRFDRVYRSKNNMRVLITTSTFPLNPDDGMPRFVFDLAMALSAICEVTVLAPHHSGAAGIERVGRLKIERFRYFLPTSAQKLAYGAGMRDNIRLSRLAGFQILPYITALGLAVGRRLRRQRFDVVNSHWLVPQALAVSAVIGHRPCCAHVATVHGGDIFLLEKLPGAKALARYLCRHTDLFLPVGEHLARRLECLAGRSIPRAVVPMGVDCTRFSRPDPPAAGAMPFDGHFILFVGRMIQIKGAACLLEAMSRLSAADPGLGLVLIGAGPLEGKLKDQAQRLGLDGRVKFMGILGHAAIPAFLRACRVLAVPSLENRRGETEGMPTVVAEALAAGCRVVASRVGAIPAVISDGVNGLLTRPGDPVDLARKLALAIYRKGGTLEASARQTAREMDWSYIAQRYLARFESVAKRPAKGS